MLRIKLMLASALVLVAVSAVPGSAAGPVKTIGSDGGRSLTAAEQQRAIDYWTPARMKRAQPAIAPEPARRSPRNGLSDEVGSNPRLISSDGVESAWPTADTTPASYVYPFPFTGYPVETALYGVAPYKSIGKIFFRQGGSNYVCSGASVVGGSKQVVFTAGHCLHTGPHDRGRPGIFSENVVFVPAYRNGSAPYGTFAADALWVSSPWANSMDFTYDMGAFNVSRNAARRTLRSVAGKLGFAFSGTRDLHWNAFGYPAAPPFTGQTLNVCQASHATDDLSTGPDPPRMAIGCDMTGGSSGGPWVIRVKSGNYLVPGGQLPQRPQLVRVRRPAERDVRAVLRRQSEHATLRGRHRGRGRDDLLRGLLRRARRRDACPPDLQARWDPVSSGVPVAASGSGRARRALI